MRSADFCLGDVSNDGAVFIKSDEVKLLMNCRACGPEAKASVVTAMCFTGLLIPGVWPNSMMSEYLLPVDEDKTARISSIDNYRPIKVSNYFLKY